MVVWLRAALVLLVVAGCSRPNPPNAPDARGEPEFVNIHGNELRPSSDPSTTAIALIFILADCPIANSYLPEINRLHQSFATRGVQLILVHADSEISASEAAEHARQYQIEPPVVLDPEHHWVQKAKATISPEAVVFSPAGDVLYHGRISDQYVALGKRRAAVTSHDLRDALEAIVAGQPIAEKSTEAVGCPIPPSSSGK